MTCTCKEFAAAEIASHIDLRKLTDDELDVIIKNCQQEQKTRKENYMNDRWQKLVAHIIDYCEEFGSIQVKEDIFIDENDNYTTPGEIW